MFSLFLFVFMYVYAFVGHAFETSPLERGKELKGSWQLGPLGCHFLISG